MTFSSILFREPADRRAIDGTRWPNYARDLNLDQIVAKITVGREEYDLPTLFEQPLRTRAAVLYRHEVMHDVENPAVRGGISSFAEQMRRMRRQIERMKKLHYQEQKQRWFVHAVQVYHLAVSGLAKSLDAAAVSSAGLKGFQEYLRGYVESERFGSLVTEADLVAAELGRLHYSVLIKGNGFKVLGYASEPDYSEEIGDAFEKFRQGEVKDHRVEFREIVEMNHVEAKVLEFVALLYPQAFARLDAFCARFEDYMDPTVARFDREIQFYTAYLEYADSFKQAGLQFCYPEISSDTKQARCIDTFDPALAAKLLAARLPVVCNSFHLNDPERIFIVSGPNQGGKTTFARTFGQLHHLAALGCPVPGSDARLFLCDAIHTHFEREENIANLRSKLEDDLVRIHAILRQATPDSIIIMNEIFTSTTLDDATFLAREVIERIIALGSLCACVTFLDELASLSPTTVSMTSMVDPDDPTVRTYKVVRRMADGRAYAVSLAEKYRLTYEHLKMRIPRRKTASGNRPQQERGPPGGKVRMP